MKKYLMGLSIFAMSLAVEAGTKSASGTVSLTASTGRIIVELTGSGNTTCGDGLRYAFTPSTDYNRVLLSMLLAAQMSGKRIWVNGQGECLTEYPYSSAYILANMKIINE